MVADTLLLADDSLTIRRLVELTVAEQGLKVVSVSDGQQAIDYLSATRPALALVSVTLPLRDGFEVARYVRDRAELHDLPVLLLAGAFDTIDEAQVRAVGAAGVLVKPFEPGLVIKRIKELLGLSSDPPTRPLPVRPPSSGGRLATSAESPVRNAPSMPPQSAPVPPPTVAADPTAAEAIPADAFASQPAAAESTVPDEPAPPAAIAADTAPPERQKTSDDFFGRLDEAFESLDAQLAGRATPAGRGTTPPPPDFDAEPRPALPVDLPALAHTGQKPRFDAADEPRSSEPAARPGGSDFGYLAPSALAAASATAGADGPVSDLDVAFARGDDPWSDPETVVRVEYDTPAAEAAPSPDDAEETVASAPEPIQSSGDESSAPAVPVPPQGHAVSAPAGGGAADAFAMIWAVEQGEPLPPLPPPPPLDLSEASVDAVALKVADRLASGIADRLMGGMSERLAQELSAPVSDRVADRIGGSVGERVGQHVADHLTRSLPDAVANALAERLGTRLLPELSERLSNGLAEQVAERVAERVMQSSFGDALRQTVHDVSERLVREEIARIRAAVRNASQ